jgi:hypothetical protein
MAAKSVHAFVMDPNGKQMDVEGDHKLRTSYSARMQEVCAALSKGHLQCTGLLQEHCFNVFGQPALVAVHSHCMNLLRARVQQLMQQQGVDPSSVRNIVDIGCATGKSAHPCFPYQSHKSRPGDAARVT